MTKTLKDILEVYEPKSPDEKKFKDKHIVVKTKDRNGNGDDVFNATNIKKIERTKTRHGYEAKKDEGVYEDFEKIDEISSKLARKYGSKATRASLEAKTKGDRATASKRFKGVNLASAKAFPNQYKNSPLKAKVPATNEEHDLSEKAPPGKKFERMVKHIKKSYSKGGVTPDEKRISYATAWKQYSKENE